MTKYGVKEFYLKAGMCHLATGVSRSSPSCRVGFEIERERGRDWGNIAGRPCGQGCDRREVVIEVGGSVPSRLDNL